VRGCCRIETGSPTCPPGPDYQEDELLPGIVYKYTRCKGNLCNDSDGDRATVKGGGVIVVEGVPEDYEWAEKAYGGNDEDGDLIVEGASKAGISQAARMTLLSTLAIVILY